MSCPSLVFKEVFSMSGTGAGPEVVVADTEMRLHGIYQPQRVVVEVISGTMDPADVLYIADDTDVTPPYQAPEAGDTIWAGLLSGTAPIIFEYDYSDAAHRKIYNRDLAQWRLVTNAVGNWEIKITAEFAGVAP